MDRNTPGEPAKSAIAGTTVFGGTTVLSAILAQSLMMVNLPLLNCQVCLGSGQRATHTMTQFRPIST